MVISAGNVKPTSGGNVIQWPAGLGLTSDVITVGSVEVGPKYALELGELYYTSPQNPAVTIGAPDGDNVQEMGCWENRGSGHRGLCLQQQ